MEFSTKIEAAGTIASLSTDELLPGVTARSVSDTERQQLGLSPSDEGVLITNVQADSPYARSLTPGMIISEINGNAVNTVGAAKKAFKKGTNKLYVYDRNQAGYLALRVK